MSFLGSSAVWVIGLGIGAWFGGGSLASLVSMILGSLLAALLSGEVLAGRLQSRPFGVRIASAALGTLVLRVALIWLPFDPLNFPGATVQVKLQALVLGSVPPASIDAGYALWLALSFAIPVMAIALVDWRHRVSAVRKQAVERAT